MTAEETTHANFMRDATLIGGVGSPVRTLAEEARVVLLSEDQMLRAREAPTDVSTVAWPEEPIAVVDPEGVVVFGPLFRRPDRAMFAVLLHTTSSERGERMLLATLAMAIRAQSPQMRSWSVAPAIGACRIKDGEPLWLDELGHAYSCVVTNREVEDPDMYVWAQAMAHDVATNLSIGCNQLVWIAQNGGLDVPTYVLDTFQSPASRVEQPFREQDFYHYLARRGGRRGDA